MGVDFIQRASRTFEKHIDMARARLGTADLFSRSPEEVCPTFPADLVGKHSVGQGQELTVEVAGEALAFRTGLTVVAITNDVPANVLAAIQDSCGVATATVQQVHPISGVIEVTLC